MVEHHNLRRQYAARWFRGRPEHFEFLMDHMVACSVLAQALGLIAYRAAEETPGRLFADDGAGAQGYLQQVYRAPGKRIYFVEGTQRGRLSAWGRGVVVVRYAPCAPADLPQTIRDGSSPRFPARVPWSNTSPRPMPA